MAIKPLPYSRYPCSNTSQLDSLINVNNKPFFKDSVVIIYTFLSCKPCHVLSSKIKKKYNNPNYLKRIIFLNNVDYNYEKVCNYINTKKFPFPYLMTKYPDFNGTYPLICFHDKNGNLFKKIEGFNRFSMIEIDKFIKSTLKK